MTKKDGGGDMKPPEDVQVLPASASGVAGDVVLGGQTLVMLENEKLFTLAVQRPRDEDKILKDLLAVVKRSQVFADDAIYSKPVGKEFNPSTGKYDGEQKYAEGLSIRAAEECRRLYGNNGCAVSVTGEDKDNVYLAAVFVDYERGTRFVIPKVVSRTYQTRDKKTMFHPPDRFADLVVPKNVSVALREAILRSIPAWMKAELEQACRVKMNKVKPAVRSKRMVEAFAKYGVDVKHIEDYIGKSVGDLKHRELNILQGLYNAIKDNELTIEEAFGIKPAKAAGATEAEKPGLQVKEPEKGKATPAEDDGTLPFDEGKGRQPGED